MQLETKRAATGEDYLKIVSLIETLIGYETRAREVQKNILTQSGINNPQDEFVEKEIGALMQEFGAEDFFALRS
jgi:hypothetical protein